MPLSIKRQIKEAGELIDADTLAATVYPYKLSPVRRMNSIVVPIPGEHQFSSPMGPEVVEFTVQFPWDMYTPPCIGLSYAESLKQWTCNSVYYVVPTGSLTNDLTEGWYLAKTISHERKAPGYAHAVIVDSNCIKYPRWDVSMQLMKIRDSDVTDCPSFSDYTISNPYADTDSTSWLQLTNYLDSSVIETQPSRIRVTHTGQAQGFALYDEEALNIMPPLGSVGPVIDIDFRIRSNTDFATVKHWATTRSLTVTTNQRQFDEFDIHNPTSYYSVWIVNGISWSRETTSGGGYAANNDSVNRLISMQLTRYWGFELLEGS